MSEQEQEVLFTDHVVSRLKDIGNGWDGRGCPKPSPKSIRLVKKYLTNIEQSRLPIPMVVPTKEGGVRLLWTSPTRDVRIDIDSNGEGQYFQVQKEIDEDGEVLKTTTHDGVVEGQKSVDYAVVWFLYDIASEA